MTDQKPKGHPYCECNGTATMNILHGCMTKQTLIH